MLTGISLTCFVASYGVTLAAEVSRLFFRARIRLVAIVAFAAAGLLAHSLFLVNLARSEASLGGQVTPLSSWFDWCLIGSWLVAAVYIVLLLRRTENSVGLFLLPLVLGLIGVSWFVRDEPHFPRDEALGIWRSVHGFAQLFGTVAVSLGFAAGLMYLSQSYRLKHKLPPRPGFRLPSLEWLQRCNRWMLLVSTGLFVVGLIAGIVMNAGQYGGRVAWTGPVVLSSSVLCAWLVVASMFEAFYKPARQGRKVAYLTLASFIFLAMTLGFVLLGDHASRRPKPTPTTPTPTTPTSEVPTSDAPTSDAPTSEAPMLEAPMLGSPTPSAPTSEVPMPEAPTPNAPAPPKDLPDSPAASEARG